MFLSPNISTSFWSGQQGLDPGVPDGAAQRGFTQEEFWDWCWGCGSSWAEPAPRCHRNHCPLPTIPKQLLWALPQPPVSPCCKY